jgi:hypothetical protein
MMKKGMPIFTFLIILGMTSSVLAQHSFGARYNPYHPYSENSVNPLSYQRVNPYIPYVYDPNNPLQNQVIGDPTQTRGFYDWSDITRYPSSYLRWYESPENYQKVYERFGEEPKTLTNPYREVQRPYSSGVLTSPFEELYPQGLQQRTSTQQLTPPGSAGSTEK